MHDSYLRTAHSRSFASVDLNAEPPDARFDHKISGKRYETRRVGEQIQHAEYLDRSGASELAAVHPVKYLVGSGRHTRSYLIEDDGFLVESPITWYASRQAWGMSPGFDHANQPGFERETDLGCLICHLGQMEPVNQSWTRPKLVELAIGCERCHGPGSQHVAERTANEAGQVNEDASMVHPGRLTREQSESICAECHLRGDATVTRPGRRLTDFRPGMALHDIRIDYHVESKSSQMKVVGHVEQMRLSRCYRESTELTCTTCHDPHGAPSTEQAAEYYRKRCLQCHEDACGLSEAERKMRKPEAADHCVGCHMPQTATDIPHIAFTHHRIAVHSPAEGPSLEEATPGALVSLDLPSDMSAQERDRNLGLAYLEITDLSPTKASAAYRIRAVDHLKRAYAAGSNDGDMLSAMARLHWEQDSDQAMGFARLALQDRQVSDRSAINALVVVAEQSLRKKDFAEAHRALSSLVSLRRHAQDWLLLGECFSEARLHAETVRCLERAAAISPFRVDIRRKLATAYREVGRPDDAQMQDAAASQLSID
jgi:predicted CXXCH cytochrome family protein